MTRKSDDSQPPKIELRPDGWGRFEKAVDAAVRTPAQQQRASHRGSAESVRLSLDASELLAALATLSTELPEAPPEIIHRAINAAKLPGELARIEFDSCAASAGELLIRLKPSDRLSGLVAALRARNADRLIVE